MVVDDVTVSVLSSGNVGEPIAANQPASPGASHDTVPAHSITKVDGESRSTPAVLEIIEKAAEVEGKTQKTPGQSPNLLIRGAKVLGATFLEATFKAVVILITLGLLTCVKVGLGQCGIRLP